MVVGRGESGGKGSHGAGKVESVRTSDGGDRSAGLTSRFRRLFARSTPTLVHADPDSASHSEALVPHPGDRCSNCRRLLDGRFCAHCGQKATELRQPIRQFVGEAFTEYFGFDGRLWTSLRELLVHPGRLTLAYLDGRRVRYLRPLRLYLSATLLFFFLLTVLDPVDKVEGLMSRGVRTEQPTGERTAAARVAQIDSALVEFAAGGEGRRGVLDSLTAVADSVSRVVVSETGDLEALSEAIDSQRDSLIQYARLERRVRQLRWQRDQLAVLPPDTLIRIEDWDRASEFIFPQGDIDLVMPDWMPRSRPVERLLQSRTSEQRAAALGDFVRNALGRLPTVMFLLLPVFALLLKLIYLRRGWFYSEHLVFALHTHAFAFLVFSALAVLIGFLGDATWVKWIARVLLLSLPIYFYVAQKRVYGQSWVKTGAKAVVLGGLYGIALFWGFILAVVLATTVGG